MRFPYFHSNVRNRSKTGSPKWFSYRKSLAVCFNFHCSKEFIYWSHYKNWTANESDVQFTDTFDQVITIKRIMWSIKSSNFQVVSSTYGEFGTMVQGLCIWLTKIDYDNKTNQNAFIRTSFPFYSPMRSEKKTTQFQFNRWL